jgi:hypothetical protein
LSRWITIGTPFISYANKRLLFSRLGIFAKAAYLAFFTLVFIYVIVGYNQNPLQKQLLDNLSFSALVLMVLFFPVHVLFGWLADRKLTASGSQFLQTPQSRFLPNGVMQEISSLLVLTVVLFTIQSMVFDPKWNVVQQVEFAVFIAIALLIYARTLAWFNRRRRLGKSPIRASWLSRWISLRHPSDEAIEGLRRLPSVSFPIFQKDFAVAPLVFAAVLSLPLLTYLGVTSPTLAQWLDVPPGQRSVIDQALFVMMAPTRHIAARLTELPPLESAVISAAVTIVVYLSIAIATVVLAQALATMVSALLSALLNRVAWSQIRASAFGNDTESQTAISANDVPTFSQHLAPSLPADLVNEITAVADGAAAASISKFRASLSRLAFGEEKKARAELVSEYLTWQELIHTAYFKVPAFNKLVATVVAQSEGFRPTDALSTDSQYGGLTDWCQTYTKPILLLEGQ